MFDWRNFILWICVFTQKEIEDESWKNNSASSESYPKEKEDTQNKKRNPSGNTWNNSIRNNMQEAASSGDGKNEKYLGKLLQRDASQYEGSQKHQFRPFGIKKDKGFIRGRDVDKLEQIWKSDYGEFNREVKDQDKKDCILAKVCMLYLVD